MAQRVLKVGVLPFGEMKAGTIAIAKGKYRPAPGEPKVWFASLKSLASVLSESNRALLQVIREHAPESITELEALTGRRASNLTRTLHTLERYGLVALRPAERPAGQGGRGPVRPVVLAEGIDLRVSF